MKNEDQPASSGLPWNTSDVVFGKLTCAQLARLATGYIGSLRMARADYLEGGTAGVMRLMIQVLQIQLRLMESNNLSPEDKALIDDNSSSALRSLCLAGLYVDPEAVHPIHLATLGSNALEAVHLLTERVGPIGEDDDVVIQIRKKDNEEEFIEEGWESIEMALSLRSTAASHAKVLSDNLGKEIEKIVKSTRREPNQNGNN